MKKIKMTKTEQNILKLLTVYPTNREIAEKLNISVNTVNTYLHAMYKRIGVKNKMELIITLMKFQDKYLKEKL